MSNALGDLIRQYIGRQRAGRKPRGRLAGSVGLALVLAWVATLTTSAQTGGTYNLTWWTIDSGGSQQLSGGAYTLQGTIGAADAHGALNGSSYTVRGGFWPGDSGNSVKPPLASQHVFVPIILK